jgi:hypothetical protein
MNPQNNNSKKPAAPHTLPVFDDQKVEMHTMQQDIQKTKPEINPETIPEAPTNTEDEQQKPEIPKPPKPPTQETPLIKDSIKMPEKKASPFDRFRKPKETKESSPDISKFKEMLPKTTMEETSQKQTVVNKDLPEKEPTQFPKTQIEENVKTPSNNNDLEIKIPGERSKLPIFIIITASLIVLVAGAGFWYYLFFIKDNTQTPTQTETKEQPAVIEIPEPKPQQITTPKVTPKIPEIIEISEPQIPASSIYFDQTAVTIVAEKNQSKLIENLKIDSSQMAGKGVITRHLFKISNPNEKSFIPTIEFLKTIGISIPSDIISELSSIEFISYKIDSKVRYGIIATISSKERLLTKMKNWENKTISDLKQLFMGESITVPENPKFSENEYLDFTKRYINLKNTDTSLDYAVSDNFLIIATSKDMMFASILQTQK